MDTHNLRINVQKKEKKEKKEGKEEIKIYGIKKTQKEKKKLYLIIRICLGIIFIFGILYILHLNGELLNSKFEINMLKESNKKLVINLEENKKGINLISLQNNKIQNQTYSFLNKCYEETNVLKKEIDELRQELLQNIDNNQIMYDNIIRRNDDLKNRINYINDFGNLC